MATLDPVTGEIISVSNTFLERISRMLVEPVGLMQFFLPLLALIGIFFIIRKFTKNVKILIIFGVIAVIIYFLLLQYFSFFYFYE